MSSVIDIRKKHSKLKKAWQPIKKAELNGQLIWLATFQGEYYWHKHDRDELFYVVKGQIVIQQKHQPDIKLKPGQMYIVRTNVWHCPKSRIKSLVLMIEPKKLKTIKLT